MYYGQNSTLTAINEANVNNIPIFSLAFGSDADYDFVNKLSVQNHGSARRIFDDDSADMQISGFYDDVAVTLLKHVTFLYENESVDTDSLTPFSFPRYFEGSELRVSGKLRNSSATELNVTVVSDNISEEDGVNLVSEAEDYSTVFHDVLSSPPRNQIEMSQEHYIEKLWAFSKVKDSINRLRGDVLESNEREKLRREVLGLSLAVMKNISHIILSDK